MAEAATLPEFPSAGLSVRLSVCPSFLLPFPMNLLLVFVLKRLERKEALSTLRAVDVCHQLIIPKDTFNKLKRYTGCGLVRDFLMDFSQFHFF